MFFTCDYIDPVFYGIAHEEKIETHNLQDDVTTFGMTKINGNYLIATGGAIYYRHENSDTWYRFTLPDGYEGANRIVEIEQEDTAYAILVKNLYTDISGYGLFKITTQGNIAKFEPIRETTSSEQILIFAQSGVDNLIAMVGNVDDGWKFYQNYQSNTPNLLNVPRVISDDTDITNINEEIIVGVAQTTSGKLFVATTSRLFELNTSTSTLTNVEVSLTDDVPLQGFIRGIYYSNQYGKLLLSHARKSEKGSYIWSTSDDGTTWIRSDKYGSRNLTVFIDITQTYFTGILVGTMFYPTIGRDEGYLEMEDGDINTLYKPKGNKYTSGKLDTAGVIGFYVDGTEFFVMTSSLGLWKGTYSNSRSVDWLLE